MPSLPRSWLIGVLLCPGDDTRVIADWASSLPAPEVGRVRFYHHPDLDLVAALEAWYDAGLPDPRTSEVWNYKTFHKQFGRHLNDQVYRDVTGLEPPS